MSGNCRRRNDLDSLPNGYNRTKSTMLIMCDDNWGMKLLQLNLQYFIRAIKIFRAIAKLMAIGSAILPLYLRNLYTK